MSCMEHFCVDCGAVWFDNLGGGRCPECKSYNAIHSCDEQPEHEEREREYHDYE